MAYDVVIVGGGTAGCVAAARLSRAERLRVLLIEAGPDYPRIDALPPDVADGSAPTTGHDWGYVSEPDDRGRSIPVPRARLMGGCSATNGAFFLRGWPTDYDAWAAAGNPGWSFDELLPWLRALENDADFDTPWHGRSGPVPVHRTPYLHLTDLQRAFFDAARACGHPLVLDHNQPGEIGIGSMPRNVSRGVRMSTALTHLAGARSRPNLELLPDTVVDAVELEGPRVIGVRLADGDVVATSRVVLTAGAYATPVLLMRSGVGPVRELDEHHVDIHVDLPGVGAGLSDHPLVAVDFATSPEFTGPPFQTILTMRSSRAPANGAPDLHLFAAGPFQDASATTGAVFGIVTGLLSPHSRGRVRLRSADPADPPRIELAHLQTGDDLARMVEATRQARELARAVPLAPFVKLELAPGPGVRDDDEDGLAASIASRVSTYHHPVGTCAMGPRSADGAVVDSTGAVHGTEGLWVADASVIPTVPVANPNLTTMVVADRIASWLLD